MNPNKQLTLVLIFLVIITAGCLSYQSDGDGEYPGPSMNYDSYELKETVVESLEGGVTTVYQNRKIISTANIRMEVESVQTAFNEITTITQDFGGFISSSSVYNTDGQYNGRMTVRVPQKNFYLTIEQIEAVGKIKSKEISGQDVTEEYIDLQARLGNLEKQEIRLQEILDMAITVEEVLQVETELERVRGEIERLTGRLNYLNQSIGMSTIAVSMAEPTPITGSGWGITDALREAVNGFINTVLVIIVFMGYVIPLLIFIVSIILITLRVKRKILPKLKS